jgi:hypothetical protein
MCRRVENLDAIECGVVGVFIAPTTKNDRWKCAVAWRTWKSPRGGVNRAKLKFTKLITTTSQVSVRNIIESAREGAKQIISGWRVRHVDLFYRGSVFANLLPVEEATKAGSLSTLTLSQTVPRTEWAFSSQSLGTQSSHKDHHKIGVSCLNYKWVWLQERLKESTIAKAKRQERQITHGSLSLSSH